MLRIKSANQGVSVLIVLFIVMIVTVVVLTSFTPSDERDRLLGKDDEVEGQYILNAKSISVEESRSRNALVDINLKDFDLDSSDHVSDFQVDDSFVLKNNLLKEKIGTFSLFVDESLENFYITFFISDKKGDGDLKLYLNGELIDKVSADIGSKVVFNVPRDLLLSGKNDFVLKVTLPIGFYTNYYSIIDLRAYMTEKEEKSSFEQSFVFDTDSVEEASIYAYVTKLKTSEENKKIRVLLNDNEIYDAVPPLINDVSPSHLEIPLDLSILNSGVNYLTWEVEEGGAYSVDFARIEYKLPNDDEDDSFVIYFNVGNTEFKKAKLISTKCILTFKSEDVNTEFDFSINGELFSAASDLRGASFDVCQNLLQGKNTLRIYPDKDMIFSEISLKIV